MYVPPTVKNKGIIFKHGVKNIQAVGYNGAHTLCDVSRILITFYKINNFPKKWVEKNKSRVVMMLVLPASNLHETPMLDLHPHYTQYVGRKLLYNFKGQTNIYLVKVSSKCEHYKTRLLLSIMNQVFLQGLGGGNLNKGIDLEFQWNAVVVIGLNL